MSFLLQEAQGLSGMAHAVQSGRPMALNFSWTVLPQQGSPPAPAP